MARVFNFSAGPAMLPEAVLRQVREDIPDWHGGMSVMEISHRSKEFMAVAQAAEQDLRELLSLPDDYAVLFVQGGATLQFAMVPLNLAAPGQRVDYVNTGSWSKKAISEAGRLADVNVTADAADSGYTDIPDPGTWRLSQNAAYLHYTPNETIGGVEFQFVPETGPGPGPGSGPATGLGSGAGSSPATGLGSGAGSGPAAGVGSGLGSDRGSGSGSGNIPLVADMSSTILSRPIDVARFGVIYAGAQKNIGPAGITVVIVRRDLLGRTRDGVPTLLSWATYAESGSMSNTPPTFAWYVAGLVFAHLKQQGGVEAIAAVNERKARKLYAAIDGSGFYRNPVSERCRSWMNVPFTLADPALDPQFLAEAEAAGLTNLRGHRSVGGMRASIYNAMPEEGVDALIDFMREFERTNG